MAKKVNKLYTVIVTLKNGEKLGYNFFDGLEAARFEISAKSAPGVAETTQEWPLSAHPTADDASKHLAAYVNIFLS